MTLISEVNFVSEFLCSNIVTKCVCYVQHIKDQMNKIGWTVSEDSFTDTTPLGDKTFVNLIAVHDPDVSRRLTLACHYDSKLFTGFEFIAATDSAVPCALMIDVARTLNASLSKVLCSSHLYPLCFVCSLGILPLGRSSVYQCHSVLSSHPFSCEYDNPFYVRLLTFSLACQASFFLSFTLRLFILLIIQNFL